MEAIKAKVIHPSMKGLKYGCTWTQLEINKDDLEQHIWQSEQSHSELPQSNFESECPEAISIASLKV